MNEEIEIIAELGSNWYHPNRSFAKANIVRAIGEADWAGATILKFQIFTADTLYSKERAPDAWKNIQKYEFPIEVLPEAHAMAVHCGIKLWASIFSPKLLEEIPLTYLDGIKIASGDLTYTDLIKEMAKKSGLHKIPLAISTGAAKPQEIRDALSTANLFQPHSVILFYCVSAYPAASDAMNLAGGLMFKDQVNAVGFSDHTLDNEAAKVATALGYTYFEKHFATYESEISPDTGVSLYPELFKAYVDSISRVRAMVGTPEKLVHRSEISERINARRGLDGLRPATS